MHHTMETSKRVVSFTLRPLYPRHISSPYALDRRLGRPQSLSGSYGEEKNLLPLPEIEPRPSSLQLVTISTELYWLIHEYYINANINVEKQGL
jgi:hypothetical protein